MGHSHLHLGQLLHIGYFLDDNKVGNLYADSGLISSDGIFICKNKGTLYYVSQQHCRYFNLDIDLGVTLDYSS